MLATMTKQVRWGLIGIIILCLLGFFSSAAETQTRGEGGVVRVTTQTGGSIDLYKGSYALLIGISDYQYWPKLESIPSEVDEVKTALKSQGFLVQTVLDPTSDELKDAFSDFIGDYGFGKENRLLFYYAGHGATRSDGKMGYLAPVDAPLIAKDPRGFKRKAVSMSQVLTWCREIEAKHVLFLFDSCFSGTIFESRGVPGPPPHITNYTAEPVRFFITAGSAKEQVPAQSTFTPSFVRGLRGEADINKDGYVTSSEIGMYLHDKLLYYRTGQTPQYGKIRDPLLDRGEFVFVLNNAGGGSNAPVTPTKDEIARLLKEAEAFFYAGDLTSPQGNNATHRYRAVLAMDPLNRKARAGLERILAKYVNWAESRIKAGDYTKAEDFIKKAEKVREGDPRVIRVRDKLLALKNQQASLTPGSSSTGSGYTTPPADNTSNISQPEPTSPDGDPIKHEISVLLKEAREYFDASQLTSPADKNAANSYRKVLALDSTNQEAWNGIDRIVTRYATWARLSIHRGDFDKAEDYLTRAEALREGDPQVLSLGDQLRIEREKAAKAKREEKLRREAEEEAARLAAIEAEKKRLAEERAKRLAAIEAERKLKAEEEARRKRQAEEAALRAKLEAQRKQQAERDKLRAELEAQRKRLAQERARLDAALEAERERIAREQAAKKKIRVKKVITNRMGMKFILIKPGSFYMGSPPNEVGHGRDEYRHKVRLTKPFYLMTTEVTQGMWREIMGNNPSHFGGSSGMVRVSKSSSSQVRVSKAKRNPAAYFNHNLPVEKVSWNDVREFIRRLNKREGGPRYRLPTEAEWEYASRAGVDSVFCFHKGEGRLTQYAWFDRNSAGKTHVVGAKRPNRWGLYDMHGNVWEWVQDRYGSYPSWAVKDPRGPKKGSRRVYRGGGWNSSAKDCRSAYRYNASPKSKYSFLGFRLAREIR